MPVHNNSPIRFRSLEPQFDTLTETDSPRPIDTYSSVSVDTEADQTKLVDQALKLYDDVDRLKVDFNTFAETVLTCKLSSQASFYITLKISERLDSSAWYEQNTASRFIKFMVPHLKAEDRFKLAQIILDQSFSNSNNGYSIEAFDQTYRCLDEVHQLILSDQIVEKLFCKESKTRQTAIRVLEKSIHNLTQQEVLKLAFKLSEKLADDSSIVRDMIAHTLKVVANYLNEENQLQLAIRISEIMAQLVQYKNAEAKSAFNSVVSYLNTEDRAALADSLILKISKAHEIPDLSFDALEKIEVILIELKRHFNTEEQTKLDFKISEAKLRTTLALVTRLLNGESRLKHFIFHLVSQILPALTQTDRIVLCRALSKNNLLYYIEFKDGGDGGTFWPHMAASIVLQLTDNTSGTHYSQSIKRVNLPDDFFGSGVTWYGRSAVKAQETGMLLVFKSVRENQSLLDLYRELVWAEVAQTIDGLRSDLITPVGVVDSQGKQGILFKAPLNYYQYLTSPDLDWETLKSSLLNAVHDAFLLAKKGLYHLVPIRLFHNAEPGNRYNRTSGDQGKYTWMADIVFYSPSRRGMGRLDNWSDALEYGNYGKNGLRDLEEVVTRDEIFENPKKWIPEFSHLCERPNAEALVDMAILGNHLLAGMLYIGKYLRNKSNIEKNGWFGFLKSNRAKDVLDLWHNDDQLKLYADLLHELFSTAHAVKFDLSIEQAKELMMDKADWTKLARQMAFFMTNAYVPFVKPGAKTEDFPKNIYGPETRVEITTDKYRDNSYNKINGWVGPSGQPDQLSLGPVNGQFPIREFEAAAYATFIPWSGVGMNLVR